MNKRAREKISFLLQSLSSRIADRSVLTKEAPRSEPELESRLHLEDGTRSLTITFCIIALAAKLCAADGAVSEEEIQAFCALFFMPEDELPKIRNLFALAVSDPNPAAHYARNMARLLGASIPMRREVLAKLCALAEADGKATLSEQRVLKVVAEALGFGGEEMHAHLQTSYQSGRAVDAYTLLRVAKNATRMEIKQAYRSRLRRLHPDLLASKQLAQEDAENARDELLAVQSAYNEIISRKRA